MTDRPKPCHHNRQTGGRATLREHTPDCPNPRHCRGCEPCPWPHCAICGRNHLQPDQSLTCTRCVASIRDDLAEIPRLNKLLYAQAVYANGLRSAAASIPGANATVLVSPFTFAADLLWSASWEDDNPVRKDGGSLDPMPPVAALAPEEDKWRTWLGQPDGPTPATVTNACAYFAGWTETIRTRQRFWTWSWVRVTKVTHHGVLDRIAQESSLRLNDDGTIDRPPDFVAFARLVARVRVDLERALHDERAPDKGIDCFECGDDLVRRYRTPDPCRHYEQARDNGLRPDQWLALLDTYPELGDEHAACDQGGIVDPDPGASWECPTCRMTYTPGEYTNAVRRDLLDSSDGDGWTDVRLAADAASTLTGRAILPATVWKWVQRGKVTICCAWSPGRRMGRRLVFWPDVADQATKQPTSKPTRRAS